MRIEELSFRFGKEIIAQRTATYASILAAVVNTQEAILRRRTNNEHTARCEFRSEGWNPSPKNFLSIYKERIAIEIEFTRHEFVYLNYLRFLSAYNMDLIDVGVLIINATPKSDHPKHLPMPPSLARVKDDLVWLRSSLRVPIWIIAIK